MVATVPDQQLMCRPLTGGGLSGRMSYSGCLSLSFRFRSLEMSDQVK